MSDILVVEDEEVIRAALKRLFERNQYRVAEASSVEEAAASYELGDFDLVIADLRLPGVPGTEIIKRCNGAPVLIMTSYSSVASAVDAMKRGAVDYIAKPFDHDEMLMVVRRVLLERQTRRQNEALKSDIQREYPVTGMIGKCDAMQTVCNRVHKVAPTDATVLVLGESGTGKELVARAIHEESARSAGPMVTVNCAAIPETLIEPELFGHVKGAFTGAVESRRGMVEAADGGTLFLDEIGELPLSAQARLLRVLQDGEIRRVGSSDVRRVDVRLVAATHRDLKQLVADELFRGDLYFRLQVMEISLPPLRERGEDIVELAEYMLTKACRQLNRPKMRFTGQALADITAYHWPGNIRELENAVERAVILVESEEVTADSLAIDVDQARGQETRSNRSGSDLSLDDYFVQFVLEHEDVLSETGIAQRLGISRKSLWERRRKLGIPRKAP